MVCRHVIVINYGYYCSAVLRSIWPRAACRAGLPARRAAAPARALGSQNPGSCPGSRSSPALASWPGSQQPSQRARLRAGALLPPTLPAACQERWDRGSTGKGCIPLENSHAVVPGKAGCKTGTSVFKQWISPWKFCTPSLSSAWDAWKCWGVFIFWRWGRTLVAL